MCIRDRSPLGWSSRRFVPVSGLSLAASKAAEGSLLHALKGRRGRNSTGGTRCSQLWPELWPELWPVAFM
eukprot:4895982-Prymnesium_polylepis.1